MRWELPYPSRRQPVLADNVVATSQPLAAQAGLTMLRRGGNAVDAAVAAAITLAVVEPTSNGIGGDAFAIVADSAGQVWGLNASGRSPAGIDPTALLGRTAMPLRGWDTVTVPGAPSAWVALSDRFGRLAFDELFAPAIAYARGGWPVGPVTAAAWQHAPRAYEGFAEFARVFLPGGRPPAAGQRFACPEQARTLEAIAASHGEAFYRGELAERIAAYAAGSGGTLGAEDLAGHTPEWVRPLSVPFAGAQIHELPPNTQGLAALLALGALDRTEVARHPPESAAAVHLQAEATKLALAEARAHVADPEALQVDPAALLAPERLAALATGIDAERAGDPGHGMPAPGGTVYLAAADADGLMVSLIQSNYHGFGSGLVVPGTGIALHNRGAGFVTTPGHPNVVAPAKRPFHTIIPGLRSIDGVPVTAFGVMGGPMQPQGHTQLALRIGPWDQNPQAAVDAPRWRVESGLRLALEPGFPPGVAHGLRQLGHEVVAAAGMGGFGGAQVVERLPGCWLAASDPRKEGQAVGW